MQVTSEAKFVDLGADSLDTVRVVPAVACLYAFMHAPAERMCARPSSCTLLSERVVACKPAVKDGVMRQVEIMMALEEKFDLQLDEEGEPQLAATPSAARSLSMSAVAPRLLGFATSTATCFCGLARAQTCGLASRAHHHNAALQALRRSPPSRTLLTSLPSRSSLHRSAVLWYAQINRRRGADNCIVSVAIAKAVPQFSHSEWSCRAVTL